MKHVRKDRSLPSIVVGKDDHKRISNLAMVIEGTAPEVAGVLLNEMDRARVVSVVAVTTVQMGSTIEFRTNGGQDRKVTLVYPGEADIAQNKVSILTPVGAALIGLSAGQSITWVDREGHQKTLTVLSVKPPATPCEDLQLQQL
jgi:regulator of nucleoside diphosphate kinase